MAVIHRIASQTSVQSIIGYAKAMRDRPDRSEGLKNEIPKLLIAGKEDMLVPLQTAHQMAGISKNCSFFELPGTAHMGFVEAKTACQKAIQGFAEQVFLNK
jgi:pimeloyl-ACP methyl ester carboxylesterase